MKTLEEMVEMYHGFISDYDIVKLYLSQRENLYQSVNMLTELLKTGVDSLDISLNGRFLLDALRADEGETVTMAFNGPTAPVLIKTERLSNVVLPVKRRA